MGGRDHHHLRRTVDVASDHDLGRPPNRPLPADRASVSGRLDRSRLPTVALNGMVGFQATRHLRFTLEGFNLLGREDDDIAYFYGSRLDGEPEEGIEDVHFHPMEKPSVRLTAAWIF